MLKLPTTYLTTIPNFTMMITTSSDNDDPPQLDNDDHPQLDNDDHPQLDNDDPHQQ